MYRLNIRSRYFCSCTFSLPLFHFSFVFLFFSIPPFLSLAHPLFFFSAILSLIVSLFQFFPICLSLFLSLFLSFFLFFCRFPLLFFFFFFISLILSFSLFLPFFLSISISLSSSLCLPLYPFFPFFHPFCLYSAYSSLSPSYPTSTPPIQGIMSWCWPRLCFQPFNETDAALPMLCCCCCCRSACLPNGKR